jgi:putative lipoic acid-binding regulatory protein
MTIPDLIDTVLGVIQRQFYPDDVRGFKRDERALMKAVARYGYECNKNSWDLQPGFIQKELLAILMEIRRSGAEFRYLPVYLEGAVDRHIRQRAEELQDKARSVCRNVSKIVNRSQRVEAVVQATEVEVLARLYQDLKRRKSVRPARKPVTKELQGELL